MKLKNKKTGEIADLSEGFIRDTYNGEMIQIKPVAISNKEGYVYGSLAELNEEWEDVPEEPFSKDFYIIFDGEVKHCIWYRERVAACPDDAHAYLGEYGREQIDNLKSVGLYFETKEEAERAVEKLKAWKRLKDKGFRFNGKEVFSEGLLEIDGVLPALEGADTAERLKIIDDLDLLFGGEE